MVLYLLQKAHNINLKFLSKEKINNPNLPSKIKTFDDLFFFRYFYGQIYMETNVYERSIGSYAEDKEIEAERIELSLIESEHDIWIGFTE